MDSKLFKAFTPFVNRAASPVSVKLDLSEHEVEDPSPTSWSSIGFANIFEGEFVVDVQGAGKLVAIQFNERMLPGAVQREKMAEKLLYIEEQTGRKPGKKEYAQIRDDVALELLPKAFIKRKTVPILFIKDKVLVFTSSAKKADDAIALLYRVIGDDKKFEPALLSNLVDGNITGALTTLAKEGVTPDDGGGEEPSFETNNSVVLKGGNKQTIRVKDKPVSSDDVSTLLKQEYEVVSLGLDYVEPGEIDASASFVLTEKLIVQRLALLDVADVRDKDAKNEADTFLATAWLIARMTDKIVDLITETMGGRREEEQAAEDDDEL